MFKKPYDNQNKLDCYHFKSVLFGWTTSPFLLQDTLDFHLKSSNSPLKNIIKEGFYVDNFQGCINCEQKLLQIYSETNKEMKLANMSLRMWVSNNSILNNKIESDFKGSNLSDVTNILGLNWLVDIDSLSFKINLNKIKYVTNITKRELLGLISIRWV